ncbi:MAG: response regulator [Thermogutta sp.]|nr:response regulator [Thermogutta sp.]
MTKILVVDDSAVDRRLICGLLERLSDVEVRTAQDGLEAAEMLDEQDFDLVITDMIMPGMHGLTLVERIRQRHPRVPVILITSQGSEEIALEALRRGAASYVPKRLAAKRLASTVAQVMQASQHRAAQTELMRCLRQWSFLFVLDNDWRHFRAMIDYVQEALEDLGWDDPAECTRITIALQEALSNAVFHGNLELSSSLRENDERRFFALAKERREQPPYAGRKVRLEGRLTPDEAFFRVRDEGPGFDTKPFANLIYREENVENCFGRGVLLMRAFMDEVVYNETGNEVRLSKRRSGGNAGDPAAARISGAADS